MSSISPVVIALVAALISGSGATAYQIYRRRSRPFVLQKSIDSGMAADHRVQVIDHVVDATSTAALIPSLRAMSSLSTIDKALRDVNDLVGVGPNLQSSIDTCTTVLQAAADDSTVIAAIIEPLRKNLFDLLIVNAVYRGRVIFPPPGTPGAATKIRIFRVGENGGSYLIAPPNSPAITFASHLDILPPVESGLQPFVAAIEALDTSSLRHDFEQLATLLRSEIQLAYSIRADLVRLIELNSRWMINFYIANYGETAMLLLPDATLEVRRNNRKDPLKVSANLRIPSDSEAPDRPVYEAAHTPLLIPPGGDAQVVALTTLTQEYMKENGTNIGDELRSRFRNNSSEVCITFSYISAGVRPRRVARTPWRSFSETP